MGKQKRPRATKAKKPEAKPKPPRTSKEPEPPKATHIAYPIDLANKFRTVLGQLPHDQISGILGDMGEHGRPVNLGPVVVPDTGTE